MRVLWSRLVAWIVRLFFPEYEEPKLRPATLDIPDEYVRSGLEFGEAVSYLHLGECDGFEGMLAAWERAEQSYASQGFRTLSLDAFVDAAAREDQPLVGLFDRLEAGEEPVLHAPYYREHFLGKVVPPLGVATSSLWHTTPTRFTLPSTLHLNRRSKAIVF